MKLAEALILRSDLQKRIAQLNSRLENNVLIQEGDKPAESPNELLIEIGRNLEELEVLIKRINRTNNETKFSEDKTLSEALTERDMLEKKRLIYANMAETGSMKFDRYSHSEIKYVATIDINKIQKQIDDLSKQWRELDTKIQSFNWQVDLL